MAVWALVLARRTGQTDLTFGAVTSGRALVDMPHVEKVVGPCCQLSPIRVRLDDGRRQTAMDLLQSVQRQAVESAAYNLIGFRGPPPKKKHNRNRWEEGATNFDSMVDRQDWDASDTMAFGGGGDGGREQQVRLAIAIGHGDAAYPVKVVSFVRGGA